MKKLLLTVLCSASMLLGYSQYYYNYSNNDPSSPPAGNPGGLNTFGEFPLGGGLDPSWTSIQATSATPVWSPTQTLPFAFNFNGAPVTQYKVSTSGVLTFDVAAAAVPPGVSAALPSTDIPDNSITIWGLAGTGANDNIVVQTFGTAPNRQHWVFFASYNYTGGGAACWHYFSIVLEEGSDRIYLVDQRRTADNACVPALSLGVQINSTTATSVLGSPFYSGFAGTDGSDADNVYFEFIQGTRPSYDMAARSTSLRSYLPLADAPFTFDARFENFGSQAVNSFDFNYSVNGGPTVTTPISGTNLPLGSVADYTITMPWTPAAVGIYNIEVWATNINGNPDGDPTNDRITSTVDVHGPFISRRLLHEDFTSSSCPPCLPGGIQLRSVMAARPDSTHTLISYPMTWPSTGDPYNTAEANDRRQYYGVNSIPNLFLDGGWDGNPNGYTETNFDDFQIVPSFMSVDATFNVDSINPATKVITVNITINPLQDNPSTFLRLHTAVFETLTENNRSNDNPNGETEWHHYMKKMLPDANGMSIPPLQAGVPYTTSLSYTFPGLYRLPANSNTPINVATEHSVEEFDDLGVVIFVQDQNTQEVFQSGYAEVACNTLVANIQSSPDNGTSNGEIQVLSVQGGVKYAYDLAGVPFNGTITGLAAGTYPVTITDGYGCTTSQNIEVGSNVSIEDDLANAGISVFTAYPNPNNGNFGVDIQLDQVDDLEVTIYDVNGRVVFQDKKSNVNTYRQDIQLTDAAAGVYMLVARTSQGSGTHRVSIK